MLESLCVSNYVLIDHLDLELAEGFSVLSGETGSGKSIILGALSLLLGGKADKDAVRLGKSSAEISGSFTYKDDDVLTWLREHDALDEDNQLLIRRVIKVNGRSSYSVNGHQITRAEGEELGKLLVDVSSQHAHQSLLRADYQLRFLDDSLSSLIDKEAYLALYEDWREKKKQLEELESSITRNEEEADYMRYCLKELDKAELKVGEEDELKAAIALMSSSEFIVENVGGAVEALKEGAVGLDRALELLLKSERRVSSFSSSRERVESLAIEAADLAEELGEELASVSYSEFELDEKNSRLSEIQRLKRRFGGSVESAIAKREEYRAKLELFENSDEIKENLRKSVDKAFSLMADSAEKISKERRRGALRLEREVMDKLHSLGMESASFKIEVKSTASYGPNGHDEVSFALAANKGERLAPLQSVASGGELSRIMLALKAAQSEGSGVATLIFDEIDAGLGGNVANNVANELKKLSLHHQVLAITHLPQLASRADKHFLVSKREDEGRTISSVQVIEGEERVKEIARLLSGDTSDISIRHAESLLEV